MKIAIMQPYFFPYIGYWQLINAVDKFVVYDNVEYTKKGWINRNRILVSGQPKYITIPLKNGSDFLDIRDRSLSENYIFEMKKNLRIVESAYRKAPYFENIFPYIREIFLFENNNLFDFIYNSICKIVDILEIKTEIIVSSLLPLDNSFKNKQRVMKICEILKADCYLNPFGGLSLYDKEEFSKNGINLDFLKTNEFTYKQFNYEFISNLSIIDVMMFNSIDQIGSYLNNYECF